jgi:hypothetical protein
VCASMWATGAQRFDSDHLRLRTAADGGRLKSIDDTFPIYTPLT